MRPKRRTSPLSRSRQPSDLDRANAAIEAALLGKKLVRVNYAALEQKTPRHPDAMFYLRAGWYRDYPFHCRDCRKLEIWTDTQQKWWYEVAKGGILTSASRCRACRKASHEKQEEHRRKTAEGYAKKKARRP